MLGRSEVAVFQNRHLPCRFDSQRNRQTRTRLFSGQLGFVLEVAVASVTLRAIPYVVQELVVSRLYCATSDSAGNADINERVFKNLSRRF